MIYGSVDASGGVARRLTSGLGEASSPFLSPDGKNLAFVANHEGLAEVYLMPAEGGPARRLTYMGARTVTIAGWSPDGRIVFASNAPGHSTKMQQLYYCATDGSAPQPLKIGPASKITFGPGKAMVIGRNTADPARWKRYRGGTAGQLWIDRQGDGQFAPLITLKSNLSAPMWIGERIYFLSDHEGIGNIYSCLPDGSDLCRHSDHEEFYARNPSTDGKRIVYHCGADLYLFDPVQKQTQLIPLAFYSPQTQRNRKFVNPAAYLESLSLHPKGNAVAITTRGKIFTFNNWEGAVYPHGKDGFRLRLASWLNDGERLLAVNDEGDEEKFVIIEADGSKLPETLPLEDFGRPLHIAVNPKKEWVAFSNHRHELLVLDLEKKEIQKIDRGANLAIQGFDWSPDGLWLAYSVSIHQQASIIKLWNLETGRQTPVTEALLSDILPSFDPSGKYLYFLSCRSFEPVADQVQFAFSFPEGVKPYLIPLQKELNSPFTPMPQADRRGDESEEKYQPDSQEGTEGGDSAETAAVSADTKEEKPEEKVIRIDLEGIERRVLAFPVDAGRYGRILGLRDGRVYYSRYPLESEPDLFEKDERSKGVLLSYSFEEHREETVLEGLDDFALSRDCSTLIYKTGKRLRILKAGTKPDREAGEAPSRRSGWLDLNRVRLQVIPAAEWRQMFREAWRLQRDHFWTPDMSQIDWVKIYERYSPLVERISSRSEFSDLMWEMQGELGTSHAYEMGGDYRPRPHYNIGFLGADFEYDEQAAGWRVAHIVRGDSWNSQATSPFESPGSLIKEGDILLAINGIRLNAATSPQAALLNQAKMEATLMFTGSGENPERRVTVKTLADESAARYREWVEKNRQKVHQASDGRLGYVHIPDMATAGYAEFHRGFLSEVHRQGLVVDVRFNSGGFVSSMLLERLGRKRIGYDVSRWGLPSPYPPESVLGPVVALTDEYSGSDGDIFSHAFKLMKLGPLLGKRTWGGVIGINITQSLVDETITTQPQYSFWFQDVGWSVENYGTDPDIEVENLPQDYVNGYDRQLERAIEEALKLLAANPPAIPSFDQRPNLALPRLPDRP